MVGKPASGVYRRSTLSSLPPEIILKSNDVVLTEVRAALNLNENEVVFPCIFNTMSHAGWYVDRLTLGEDYFHPIQSDSGSAGNRHPMLRAVCMLLIAQSLSWQHFDPFDLVVGTFVEDGESSPGSTVKLWGLVSCVFHVGDCTARASDPAIA